MKRAILDTNIYGKIIEKMDIDFVLDNLQKSSIIIYGSDVIRKELRDTPKEKIMITENKKIKIRLLLLTVYDFIVKGHQFKTTMRNLKMKSARSDSNKLFYTFPYFRIFHSLRYVFYQLFFGYIDFFMFFDHISGKVNQIFKPFA